MSHGLPLAGMHVVFGGSFNPPHMGHQMLCLYLLEGLGAQRVFVVPCGHHAFGKALAPFDDRVACCEALIAPLGGNIEVSRVEADDSRPSRTLETLKALQAERPDAASWGFVIGSDLVADLPKWHGFAQLIACATPIVVGRGGFALDAQAMRTVLGDKAVIAPIALPQISSTELRADKKKHKDLSGRVPKGVLALLDTAP